MIKIHSGYMKNVFNPDTFPRIIDSAFKTAEKIRNKHPYDSIAFCGMSGCAMAFILAHKMGLPMLCVRKQETKSHFTNGGKFVEGNLSAEKYLIIDDFMAVGDTVRYIIKSIKNEVPVASCSAILLYSQRSNGEEHWRPDYDDKTKSIPRFGSKPEYIDEY